MSYLHVRVVQGRNLPAADPNGLSDPYVKIKMNGHKEKSQTIDKTLNPEWNFDASFPLPEDAVKHELLFEVFDEDKLSSNDFLGQLKFDVYEILEHKTVAGYFELFDQTFDKKVGGDIYLIIRVGEKLEPAQRKALLNGIAAETALKAKRK